MSDEESMPLDDMQTADELVDDMPDVLTLAGDFPEPTRERWEEEVAKTFNRKRPEDKHFTPEQCLAKLRSRTIEGIEIEPLYTPDDRPQSHLGYPGVAPFRRGAAVRTGTMDAWDVRQLHDDPDPARCRKAVLADLERGVTSIWARLGPGAIAYADLGEVLADVLLDLAPIAVSSTDDQAQAAETLLAVWRDRETEPASVRGNLGLDPLGHAAVTGGKADFGPAVEYAQRCLADHPGVHALVVDAAVYHDAGASDVDELAMAIATGVEYVRELEAHGVRPTDAFAQLDFRVSATADQFSTIARLRALRQLWHRIAEVCEVPATLRGARQHAVTSWRMMTRDDPWVNMLRVTTACFAASAGGAESVTVLPFDHVHGLPDVFSRRIARNTQIVLAEESNIGRVNDPAGGSWYVESLTDSLATKAWSLFQRIEAEGGMTHALTGSDMINDRLADSCQERSMRIANRSAPITGVSMFPQINEKPLERAARETTTSGGLSQIRDAAVFENLRDRAARHAEERGAAPTAFLATIGLRRDYGARETFVTSLLAAAAIDAPATESISASEMVDGFKEAKTSVAVLCSSAKMYAEHALEIARALRDAGATRIYLAGSAKELGDQDHIGLIDDFIYSGMDVVTLLTALHHELGVAE